MNKGLEALEELRNFMSGDLYCATQNRLDTIEAELKRLEEREERVKTLETLYQSLDERYRKALVKNQKQDEILRIIKEKKPFLDWIENAKNKEEYNQHYFCEDRHLIQVEFDLLKEWLK